MLDWVYTSVLGLQESFPFTAVTQALTRALKGFFLWFKPAIWWTSINPNPVYALANRRFFPRFSSSGRKMSAFKQFLLYVKIIYKEYEFVECLSEETRIIDLFEH